MTALRWRGRLAALSINRAFVLYVPGGFDSKNFERLFEAFSKLPESVRAEHQLVITGRLDDGLSTPARTAAKYGLSQEELLLVGYVSDELLLSLYRSAALFVFPSLGRVWSTGARGHQLRCPTIASNASSLPEVVGNARLCLTPPMLWRCRKRWRVV